MVRIVAEHDNIRQKVADAGRLDFCSHFVLIWAMPTWPPEIAKKVAYDVSFALTFKVGRSLRPLTDLERRVVAKTIVDYLQLSNWMIERGPPGVGASGLYSGFKDPNE
jgi:hypothetical protein